MATKLLYGALAIIPSALALSTPFTTPANAFEVERGPHGAYRIVTERRSKTPAKPHLKAPTPKGKTQRSTIIIRGPHGAQKIVPQKNIGGPVQNHKGFPKIERRGSHGGFRIVND